jgi:DegV family protein with EDD domain
MNYIIATDSGCDLSASYIEKNNIHLFSLTARIDGLEITDDLGKSYSHKDFYDQIRKGCMPTTSQVNMFTFKQKFLEWVKDDISVLYIAFSGALSGTCQSALMAREEILEEFPHAKIAIVDTLCASGGLGLLVHKTVNFLKAGNTYEEAIRFTEENKHKIMHTFTVDDLNHLERGGRISQASAFVGTLLQIKPVLYVNDEGKLIPYQKCRGRKKAIRTLVDHFSSSCTDQTGPVFITHSDCEEEAKALATILESEFGAKEIHIYPIGVMIGSHTGPNTLALCFTANKKALGK